MYLANFNLLEKPFQITTDSRFLWLGEKHKEAFATLKYGMIDNKGFLLLTGDVGTGKTTLINALVNSLDPSVLLARVPDPRLTEMDFFQLLANEFKIEKKFQSKGEFIALYTEFLIRTHAAGKQVLLIVDEAQRVQLDLLEEIRLLSNIEKEHVKLLNIFFVGQVEFNDILLDTSNRAIRQRITVNYTLEALSEEETGEYVRHRMDVAGCKDEIFDSGAIHEVFTFSQGAPRLINIICDRALLTGFVENKKKVNADIISECAAELQIPSFANRQESGTAQTLVTSKHGHQTMQTSGSVEPLVEIELDLAGLRKKREGTLGVYLVYVTLVLLVGALCGYFFYLPG